jgi:hypothetical protein
MTYELFHQPHLVEGLHCCAADAWPVRGLNSPNGAFHSVPSLAAAHSCVCRRPVLTWHPHNCACTSTRRIMCDGAVPMVAVAAWSRRGWRLCAISLHQHVIVGISQYGLYYLLILYLRQYGIDTVLVSSQPGFSCTMCVSFCCCCCCCCCCQSRLHA